MSFFFTQKTQDLGKLRSNAVFLFHAENAELWEWSPLRADTFRVIKQNKAIQRITSLDCFVVPPRNDAKRRKTGIHQVQRILRFRREIFSA